MTQKERIDKLEADLKRYKALADARERVIKEFESKGAMGDLEAVGAKVLAELEKRCLVSFESRVLQEIKGEKVEPLQQIVLLSQRDGAQHMLGVLLGHE